MMELVVMGLTHAHFSEGGSKAHIGFELGNHNSDSLRTFCGIENVFCFMGPEVITEDWITYGGEELCKKCAKSALTHIRQQAKAGE